MAHKLERDLGLLDVFCLASGAMISSGIFVLPGLAYVEAGPLVFLSYALAGVLALIGTLSIIELSTAMPKAGGDYFFITRSLGPLAGTISSFLSWGALCLKSAFAIFGIAEIIYLAFGVPVLITSFFICAFFTALNIRGVKEAAKLEIVLVLFLFALMTLFMAKGATSLSHSHFRPLLPKGMNGILATAGFVFISFGGLLNIAAVSGEVKNPTRTIPKGILLSILAVTLLYAGMLIVTVGLLPEETLSSSLTPIADAGRILFGQTGYVIISAAALLAFVTTANAGVLSASRYPLALSHDGLLPGAIGALSRKHQTPVAAIILTGSFIFLCLTLDLAILVKLGSVVILTLYILTNIAVIILREGKVQNYRPSFLMPLYPWTNIVSIIIFSALVADIGLVAVELSLSVVVLAALLYFFYGRTRHNIEYALLHVIERIIDKRITSNTLENELKNVIMSRDALSVDRFHKLVEESLVLDIDTKVEFEDFIKHLSESVAGEIGLLQEEIIALFKEREAQGTTAITSFVAIPHIIIPGENRFKLVAVRCREGIRFHRETEAIKAVFVLFGTKDERAFHLKVLSAFAHIVQHPHFEGIWLGAKNKQQLKDIILLSERRR